jgi:hypothetical protein
MPVGYRYLAALAKCPRVNQLDSAIFVIACVARCDSRCIRPCDSGDLAIELADRPSPGAACGGDSGVATGRSAIKRQNTVAEVFFE